MLTLFINPTVLLSSLSYLLSQTMHVLSHVPVSEPWFILTVHSTPCFFFFFLKTHFHEVQKIFIESINYLIKDGVR